MAKGLNRPGPYRSTLCGKTWLRLDIGRRHTDFPQFAGYAPENLNEPFVAAVSPPVGLCWPEPSKPAYPINAFRRLGREGPTENARQFQPQVSNQCWHRSFQ